MNTVAEKNAGQKLADQEAARAVNYIAPEVNIFESKDGYVLEAEMPGVSRAGVEISVEGNELTIVGRREASALKGELLHRESATADYRRAFELDPAIDTVKIDAKVNQGVLTIHLPKSERVKPRKVTVSD
jgi:HSP20 family protein